MKKVSKIITIGIFILFLGSFGNFADGRSAGLDYGGSGIPFSKNNTTVYLKSANIYAILNYTYSLKEENGSYPYFPNAIEDATYIFKNDRDNFVKINITLPFYFNPKNINLTENGEPLNFSFGRGDWDSSIFGFKLVYFYLEFEPFEEKKVNVNYNRNFGKTNRTENGNTYFNYRYLTETGKFWNKSIEYAKFTFVIEKHENLETNNTSFAGFEVEENSTHYTLSREYSNWNFTEDILIQWTITEKIEENQSFLSIIMIVVFVGIFIVAIVFAFMKK